MSALATQLFRIFVLFASASEGKPCEERLNEVAGHLAAARAKARGAVYHAPELETFEPAIVAAGSTLEFKGLVAQIGIERAWLDGDPAPGTTARERLATLSARIDKMWSTYRLLHPDVPPNRQLYVMFDRRVTVRDAAEVVAAIGRDDRLIPLVLVEPPAKRRLWFGVFETFLRATPPGPDAITSATPGTRLRGAFRSCPTKRRPPAPGLSEDEYRALAHREALEDLRACHCADADVGRIEELFLWNAGEPEPSMRRLPLELVASGGKTLAANGDTPLVDLLAKEPGNPTGPPKRVTIEVRKR